MSESTIMMRAEEEEDEDLPQPQAPPPQALADSNTEAARWLNYIDERMKAWCAGEGCIHESRLNDETLAFGPEIPESYEAETEPHTS